VTADRVALYRAAMLMGKAVAAGELPARGQVDRELDLTARIVELRYGVRRSGWPAIARRAAAHGRTWTVLQ
jgi:hypothetical protein